MGILSWLIVGLIAGCITRWFFPGRKGSTVALIVMAMVGALIGGYISAYFGQGTLAVASLAALLNALLGALLLLVIARITRL